MQISSNSSQEVEYHLTIHHVVDTHIHIFNIVTDLTDTSGESKDNIGTTGRQPKKHISYPCLIRRKLT